MCEFKLELRSGNSWTWFWPLWPWIFTSDLDFCMGTTSVIDNNSWKFHDDTKWRTDERTGRMTDWTIAWSQLKRERHVVNANLKWDLLPAGLCCMDVWYGRTYSYSSLWMSILRLRRTSWNSKLSWSKFRDWDDSNMSYNTCTLCTYSPKLIETIESWRRSYRQDVQNSRHEFGTYLTQLHEIVKSSRHAELYTHLHR